MNLEARLAELSSRHQDLESQIAEEMRRPGSDTTRVTEMKKRKLRLKDQIALLQSSH